MARGSNEHTYKRRSEWQVAPIILIYTQRSAGPRVWQWFWGAFGPLQKALVPAQMNQISVIGCKVVEAAGRNVGRQQEQSRHAPHWQQVGACTSYIPSRGLYRARGPPRSRAHARRQCATSINHDNGNLVIYTAHVHAGTVYA